MEKVAGNMRDRLLSRLLFHLGYRVSEALALTISDINFDAGTVTIKHLKSRFELSCLICGARLGATHVFCPQCGDRVKERVAKEQQYRRRRVLPVNENTMETMKQYIAHGGPVTKQGKNLLFGINRHRSWQVIRDCAEKAGLPKLVTSETGKVHNVSPHRLRDAFAVNAMKLDDSGDRLRLVHQGIPPRICSRGFTGY